MRRFGTEGPVSAEKNYIVSRATELADFIDRVKQGKYLVIFAPRQTGKTTFFRLALDALVTQEPIYFPIPLNFETYEGCSPSDFYEGFCEDIREEVEIVFQTRGEVPPAALTQFLENAQITNHLSVRRFFREFARLLVDKRIVLIIDEFDGIPQGAVKGFLHSLRHIYLLREGSRCPYSLGIVGVKSITQLDYDRSISPFNIQDEFHLPNFTLEGVRELLVQYTEEVGQVFMPEVIENLHKQTAGQPFLVNRFAQILTTELEIPKTEAITMGHFSKAHTRILREQNRNIQHLLTNIRRNPRFETLLMEITSYDKGVDFNLDDEVISELATYGVITESNNGFCEIVNPIYQYRIMRAFKQPINGLEREYFPEDTRAGFRDYLTPNGHIHLQSLLDNFKDFIARGGDMKNNFEVKVNAKTHLVVQSETGRCLGGVGANFYRPFVFPFYTPAGHTVVQEFAFDHPFHNGIFVGQGPVQVGDREAGFWASPPRRSFTDKVFEKLGRMDTQKAVDITPHTDGVQFVQNVIWRDENEEPMIDEIRTVNLFTLEDATVCDMTSEKIAAYGAVTYPQTKFGSIGIRVEPRLLPVMGGIVLGDNGRKGGVEVVHEGDSDFVAYQNVLAGHGAFGVFMSILNEDVQGPWFIRDYGMALYNPTWTGAVSTPAGERWKVALRVIAYDGKLTPARAEKWCLL